MFLNIKDIYNQVVLLASNSLYPCFMYVPCGEKEIRGYKLGCNFSTIFEEPLTLLTCLWPVEDTGFYSSMKQLIKYAMCWVCLVYVWLLTTSPWIAKKKKWVFFLD